MHQMRCDEPPDVGMKEPVIVAQIKPFASPTGHDLTSAQWGCTRVAPLNTGLQHKVEVARLHGLPHAGGLEEFTPEEVEP